MENKILNTEYGSQPTFRSARGRWSDPADRSLLVVTRYYSSGLLNFATHSPEDSQGYRKSHSARLQQTGSKGPVHYRTAVLCASPSRGLATLRDRWRSPARLAQVRQRGNRRR
jgi:hypothetical protein